MFILRWRDAERSVDSIDASIFFQDSNEVKHLTRWNGSKGDVVARAAVTVDGTSAIMDYGGDHEEFNAARGVDIVRVRFDFADAERIELKSVSVLDEGDTPEPTPEIIDTADVEVEEGERILVTHFRRERDTQLRALRLREADGEKCATCDVKLTDRYEEYAPSFDVHHEVAVSSGPRNSRIRDLAVLCPNCHRAIHKTKPLMKVSDFRAWYARSHLDRR